MISPIHNNTFKADTYTINTLTGEYKDPLMHWPLRGAAFTNEIGEALRPLIGEYATLSWAPALLYIGADIYDKYKNDQTEYSPNSKRCLKQAIFQGMASIFLPLVAVKAGQNLFSLFGMTTKDNLTFNVQENITKIGQEFVANGNMRAYRDKEDECIKVFTEKVLNNIDFKKNKDTHKNNIKKYYYNIEDKISNKLRINKKQNIINYSENLIKNLIKTRKDLLEPTDDFKNEAIYNNYLKALNSGQTKNVAVKNILDKKLINKNMTGRYIKTLGGFLALGLAIKPIDRFVEDVLIGKVVGPSIDKSKETSTKK